MCFKTHLVSSSFFSRKIGPGDFFFNSQNAILCISAVNTFSLSLWGATNNLDHQRELRLLTGCHRTKWNTQPAFKKYTHSRFLFLILSSHNFTHFWEIMLIFLGPFYCQKKKWLIISSNIFHTTLNSCSMMVRVLYSLLLYHCNIKRYMRMQMKEFVRFIAILQRIMFGAKYFDDRASHIKIFHNR